MYRKGKYTKRLGIVQSTKRVVGRRLKWWKGLSRKKKIIYTLGPLFAFMIIVPLGTYLYFIRDIDNQERLMNRNNTGVELVDIHGKRIYSFGRSQHQELTKLADISENVQKALIASEDKNFYEHNGFSVGGTLNAVWQNIRPGGINNGGSTLTQQLAKNTLLTNQRTFLRKYQELSVAIAIEQRYTKDEILDMYLNSVYFGESAFGIQDAAKAFFNKSPKDLDLAESAMIIGVLPAPSSYSPITGDIKLAEERQNTVLSRMVSTGKITDAEKQAALKENLHYAKAKSRVDNGAPHFTEMVLSQLYEKYGEEKVNRSGYKVTTTLDMGMQRKANDAVDANIAHIQANNGSNASLIAVDPKSGEVRAYVGSADYNNKKFGKVNMVTTPRQPGSSFKPIYYTEGLAQGKITPATILNDAPTDFGGYSPENASRTYSGDISVRNAISRSLNIPSVKVLQKVGISDALSASKKMGITTIKGSSEDYGLAFALGVAEVPLEEMTNAYAGFANQGEQYPTSIIKKIDSKYNETIFKTNETSKRIVSSQAAFLISDILSDNAARDVVFNGTLTLNGHKAAVKTGTTEDAKDAWTIGYTPSIAAGVWVGNNDNTAMYSGGSDMAGPIWRSFMNAVLEGKNNESFAQPAGVVKVLICSNGKRASSAGIGTRSEYFLASNQPTENCNVEKKQEPEKTQPKKTETKQKCTVAGKENLTADDEKCVVDPCPVPGKENLASNDPNCVDTTQADDDGDGVPNDSDQCPDTPQGTTVDSTGCPTTPKPPTKPTSP